MSMNRPRSLGRQRPPRSLTLPAPLYDSPSSSFLPQDSSSTVAASALSSTDLNLTSYLPSMEESLQDWLTRNIPDTANNSPSSLSSLLHEACPCCGKHDCEHMETLYKTMRKLESDTRLAAEIGQGLLHKHESLVAETNQTKEVLEEQLGELRQKVTTLEELLIDADNSKQELIEQKDRAVWKWQKSQKTVQETMVDLEKANERCIDLGNELKNKTKEVEKLRIFKFMVRQADYREDMLRSQLEDTNQELAISRKNELMLESKYKKLKERYETVCTSYENFKLVDQPFTRRANTVDAPNNTINTRKHSKEFEYLWKSNEQLRTDIVKLTSFIAHPTAKQQRESQPQQQSQQPDKNYLITLIKELALANAKLKMDLLTGNLAALEENLDDSTTIFDNKDEPDDDYHYDLEPTPKGSLTTEDGMASLRDTPSSPFIKVPGADISATHQGMSSKVPSPTTSTSLPTSTPDVVHYHYHYHMQNKKKRLSTLIGASPGSMSKNEHSITNQFPGTSASALTASAPAPVPASRPAGPAGPAGPVPPAPTISLSPTSQIALSPPGVGSETDAVPDKTSVDANDTTNEESKNDSNTPYHQLQTHASHVFDRLKSTDIRSLNRRLKRAFDMVELSKMSNSIIDSILADILLFQGQFLWLKNSGNGVDGYTDRQQGQHNATLLLSAFFPTLALLQSMLQEIGELRMTMNDLQVEYVKKVEEIQQLVEKDILRKRLESTQPSDPSNSARHPGPATAPPSSSSSSLLGDGNKGALAWLSNVFHIQTTSSSTPKKATSAPSSKAQQQSIRFQRSHDSLATTEATTKHGGSTTTTTATPSSSSSEVGSSALPISKQVSLTTSSSLRIKQKKHEFDRFGPPSSFPRTTPLNDQKRRRQSQPKHDDSSLRPSVSVGPTRKATASVSPGIWSPLPPSSSPPSSVSSHGANMDKTVQRKRSLLGLGSSSEPLDKLDSIDWKLGTSFGGSWLGT